MKEIKMKNNLVFNTKKKPERQKKAIMERIDNEVKKQGGMFKYPILKKKGKINEKKPKTT